MQTFPVLHPLDVVGHPHKCGCVPVALPLQSTQSCMCNRPDGYLWSVHWCVYTFMDRCNSTAQKDRATGEKGPAMLCRGVSAMRDTDPGQDSLSPITLVPFPLSPCPSELWSYNYPWTSLYQPRTLSVFTCVNNSARWITLKCVLMWFTCMYKGG